MKAVVVYESLWGNTAAIARAIAEGLGPDAIALSTAEATPARVAGVDLLVAGAPIQGFGLPSARMRAGIKPDQDPAPDLSMPTLDSWLEGLPAGSGRFAAFETKIWWSPGSAAAAIDRELTSAGYRPVAKPEKFIVKGQSGPLKDGELERARAWGSRLRAALA
ncbi:MAG TPA: flavodoxin family protein [Candidatus Limnocylindrales bacterium]|nr:flavodoxin family protein [Candidatus Limnocylindrales bacterium]